MTMLRNVSYLLLGAGTLALFMAVNERPTNPASDGLFAAAQAVVGRPLTPVSVAGVARRTVRRCATGVYNC
jgi:hypothetical protein